MKNKRLFLTLGLMIIGLGAVTNVQAKRVDLEAQRKAEETLTGINLTPSLEGRVGEGLKLLIDGVLYIVHDGKILDATGKLVK